MSTLISISRSIIPACDVGIERFEDILRETSSISQVGAYKISASLGLSAGLPKVVDVARKYTDKPLIYDHQKAGTDIPDTGLEFMSTLKKCGIDAVIIFPLAGPATQAAWISAAKEVGLPLISGGHMTHQKFIASDGGYINDSSIENMYRLSAHLDVTDYVVPGNKPDVIRNIKALLTNEGVDPVFYAPGFVTQGGSISEAAQAAGVKWHAIVGRAIYDALDIQKAATELVRNL